MKKLFEIYSGYFSNQKSFVDELIKILGFGLLSLLLGKIQFYIPGIEGSVSDLREIGLIIGVFYFRHWFSVIFVSLITSIGTPPDGSVLATFLMHSVALLSTYFIFYYLNKNIRNRILLSAFWLLVGVVYFLFFLIPTMVITYYFIGFTTQHELLADYFKIIEVLRFEIVSTTAVKTTEVLTKQNRELEISVQKSEESEKLKTAFLQNLSHEIRTPMNGILGFSRLLQYNNHDKLELEKYTQQIINSGEQLLHIVNDIIDASQIETHQIRQAYSRNSLDVIINEIITIFKLREDLNYSRILTSFICEPDCIINTDIYKVSRSVYHVLDNALKFSHDMPVELEINVQNNTLEISVKDYGIGIDEKDWNIIFESFRQLDNDSTRNYGGNGLGLTIAKGFVAFLNGTIWLTSEVGKGSTFYLSVPVEI
jgi:signal transduction histidine kinase